MTPNRSPLLDAPPTRSVQRDSVKTSAGGGSAMQKPPAGGRRGSKCGPRTRSGCRAAGREPLQEALEVVDVEDGGRGAAVAVGVGIARRELLQEALEVVDVEEGYGGAQVAVGVARGAAAGAHGDIDRTERGAERRGVDVHGAVADDRG